MSKTKSILYGGLPEEIIDLLSKFFTAFEPDHSFTRVTQKNVVNELERAWFNNNLDAVILGEELYDKCSNADTKVRRKYDMDILEKFKVIVYDDKNPDSIYQYLCEEFRADIMKVVDEKAEENKDYDSFEEFFECMEACQVERFLAQQESEESNLGHFTEDGDGKLHITFDKHMSLEDVRNICKDRAKQINEYVSVLNKLIGEDS